MNQIAIEATIGAMSDSSHRLDQSVLAMVALSAKLSRARAIARWSVS
jgi:hypothetical protein